MCLATIEWLIRINSKFQDAKKGALYVLSRRNFIVTSALLGAAGAANLNLARTGPAVSTHPSLRRLIPATIGPWYHQGSDGLILAQSSPLSERIYDDLLTRVYVGRGLPSIMLLIGLVSTQEDQVQIHRPEACYPPAGFKLAFNDPKLIQLRDGRQFRAASLTATAPERIEQILYWTRIGQDFPQNYFEQEISTLRQSLLGMSPDGVLVRASAIGEKTQVAAALTKFVEIMANSASAEARALLVGAPTLEAF